MLSLAQRDVQKYLNLDSYPILTPEEESKYALDYFENKNMDSAQKLVMGNLRLVIRTANEHRRKHEHAFDNSFLLDMIQEGTLGLMVAVERFDPYRNVKLMTYAIHWIELYIQRYCATYRSIVVPPDTRQHRIAKRGYSRVKKQLEKDNIATTHANIAKILNVPEGIVCEMDYNQVTYQSLNRSVVGVNHGAESGLELIDCIKDKNIIPMDEQVELDEGKEKIQYALNNSELNEREQTIMKLHYLSEEPLSFAELSKTLGVSRQRVEQIGKIAFTKITKTLKELYD